MTMNRQATTTQQRSLYPSATASRPSARESTHKRQRLVEGPALHVRLKFKALPILLPGTDAQTVDVEYIAFKQQGPWRGRKRDYGSETSSSPTKSSKPGARRERILEALS